MPLTVTLELTDDDLDHFRAAMRRVRSRHAVRTAEEIATAAAREVARVASSASSPFIRRRIERVAQLVAMLGDPQWKLPGPERRRVLEGLAYVADAHDLVSDDVPVLGLLDDAIMLELVLRDLRHELEGYEEFDAYRREESMRRGGPASGPSVTRQDWLDSRREALHARIRERRERDLAGHGGEFELITHF